MDLVDTLRFEPILQWAKRLEQRLFLSDYEEAYFREKWLQKAQDAKYQEKVFPIVPKKESLKSILVYKPDEIGDAVCALPALKALRQAMPESRIYLICQKKTAPLFLRTGLVDEISGIDVKSYLSRFTSFSLNETLRSFSDEEFDVAIFLRTYPAYFKQFLKIPSRVKIHPREPRMRSDSLYQPSISLWTDQRKHQILQLLEIIRPLTGKEHTLSRIRFPKLRWTAHDKKTLEKVFGKKVPEKFFVLHPYASFETRIYPHPYWKRIILALRRTFQIPMLVVGGPADKPLVLGPTSDSILQIQGKLSLSETAYLISRSSAFIGNLSGPAHLAGSLSIPSVIFFGGHSLAKEWAPMGRTLLLRADVPCSPCHRRVCPGYDVACLKELSPDRIFGNIRTFLEENLN